MARYITTGRAQHREATVVNRLTALDASAGPEKDQGGGESVPGTGTDKIGL